MLWNEGLPCPVSKGYSLYEALSCAGHAVQYSLWLQTSNATIAVEKDVVDARYFGNQKCLRAMSARFVADLRGRKMQRCAPGTYSPIRPVSSPEQPWLLTDILFGVGHMPKRFEGSQ